MRLLLTSFMIFFGTLLAAGLLALGEPDTGHVPAWRATESGPGAAAPSASPSWGEHMAANLATAQPVR